MDGNTPQKQILENSTQTVQGEEVSTDSLVMMHGSQVKIEGHQ